MTKKALFATLAFLVLLAPLAWVKGDILLLSPAGLIPFFTDRTHL